MDLSIGTLSMLGSQPQMKARVSNHGQESPHRMGSGESAAPEETKQSESQRPVRSSSQTSELTSEEQAQVKELQQRDRQVRAHEAAHRAAAAGMASGGSYTYQTGPDGRRYAVGGEVSISASYSGSPQERLRQAETLHRAALAPADPSPQDRMVAAQAAAMASQARAEISAARREEMAQQNPSGDPTEVNSNSHNSYAIASFSGVSASATLQTTPSTIDEII
ncbi:MAG: putative metalloprotease CJM1_0395 family protein [Candidatus Thiodiazotropha sp.]